MLTISQRVEIYALSCPISGEVRYVGKANDSAKRLKSHIRDSRTRNTPVYCWFRKLAAQNLVPAMAVIAVVEDGNWQEVERAKISSYRASGVRLLNLADGGDEPFCSTEQRAENGRANAKAIHSDPRKKRIWKLKRDVAAALTYLKGSGNIEAYNRSVTKLHLAAEKAPALFGQYLALAPILPPLTHSQP